MKVVPSQPKLSIYDTVTQKIVAMIETTAGTYKMPLHVPYGMAAHPTNASTRAEYRGVNILMLWAEAVARGYVRPFWASYRQWQSVGAQVRHGERGTMIVFYKRIETTSEQDDSEKIGSLRFVAKASWVFNAAQVDGYEPPLLAAHRGEIERIAEVEAFVTTIGPKVRPGSAFARYCLGNDTVEMPDAEWFVGTPTSSPTESYYAVLLHEMTHWTGAPHRLNRTFGKRFGDSDYAFEELVAEIGAAFASAAFGISTEPRPDHAAYVSSWLDVLNRDSRAIFTAASKAQEAFEHLAYLATRNGQDTD